MGIPADVLDFSAQHGLTQRAPLQSGLRSVIALGLYAGAAALAFAAHHPGVWLAVWLWQAVLLAGAYSAMHEASHDALFRSKRLNRVAGILWAGAVLIDFSSYRAFHLHHHSHTRTDDDSEPQGAFGSLLQYVVGMPIAGFSFVVTLAVGAVRTVSGMPPHYVRTARQRRAITADLAALLALLAIVAGVASAAPRVVLLGWVVPVCFTYGSVMMVTALPEHYGCPRVPDPLANTRTVRSNPVFRFLYWNNNFHAEHHLYPAVPYNHTPTLHRYLRGRHEHLDASYLGFHLTLARSLARGDAVTSAPAISSVKP